MDFTSDIEEVQVSEFRKRYAFYLEQKKPLILLKNSSVVGLLFCVDSNRWRRVDRPQEEGNRLYTEFKAVLHRVGVRYQLRETA